jgi:hypothetical protein
MQTAHDDEDFDVFDQMEIEKRFSFVVGHAFSQTHLHQDTFQHQLSHLYQLLARKQKKFSAYNVADSVQMFLGTSYRSAKTAHLIFNHAQDYAYNSRLYGHLLLVHHDLVDGSIHPLYACLNYFRKSLVADLLGAEPEEFTNLFKDVFGEHFLEARNAIAHEEDRMVPSQFDNKLDLAEQIKRVQHRGTTGSKLIGLHARNSAGETFEFDFSEAQFIKLLEALLVKLA